MIHTEIDNSIAIIRLELESRNSFSYSDILELSIIIEQIEGNQTISGMIITGTGKVFSTGAAISEFKNLSSKENIDSFFESMDELLIKLFSFKKPLVTAVNGHSIGLGFLIQICGDYVVSSNSSKIKFGLPESKIGLILDQTMIQLIKWNNIKGKLLSKLILNGELLNIDEATELKVIDLLTDESDLINLSKHQVYNLLQENPAVFHLNKKIIRESALKKMRRSFKNNSFKLYADLLLNNNITRSKLEIC